jgi:hypothetical protein
MTPVVVMVPKKRTVMEQDGTEERTITKTRDVVKTRTEQKTKMVPKVVSRCVPSPGFWAFIGRSVGLGYMWQDEVTTEEEKYEETIHYPGKENYTEYVTVPRIVTKEVIDMVPEQHHQETMQNKIQYTQVERTRSVLVKVEGIRTCKKELTITGTRTRGWELKAPWSDPKWDQPTVKILEDKFVPHA